MQNQTFAQAKQFIENQRANFTMWTKQEQCVFFYMKDKTVAAVTDNSNFAGVLSQFVQ